MPTRKDSDGLNAKQRRFCAEYVVDLNATQAAIRAGYSTKTAHVQGHDLLRHPNVGRYCEELKRKREEATLIDAQYVLTRLAEIAALDVSEICDDDGDVLPVSKWPLSWRRSVNAIDVSRISAGDSLETVLKKIRWPDRLRTLELLGKHVAVKAFAAETQDLTIQVTGGMPDDE